MLRRQFIVTLILTVILNATSALAWTDPMCACYNPMGGSLSRVATRQAAQAARASTASRAIVGGVIGGSVTTLGQWVAKDVYDAYKKPAWEFIKGMVNSMFGRR